MDFLSLVLDSGQFLFNLLGVNQISFSGCFKRVLIDSLSLVIRFQGLFKFAIVSILIAAILKLITLLKRLFDCVR